MPLYVGPYELLIIVLAVPAVIGLVILPHHRRQRK